MHISTLALDDEDYTSTADIAALQLTKYLTVVQYNATTGLGGELPTRRSSRLVISVPGPDVPVKQVSLRPCG